ncbi:phosphotransferase [Kribbella italica]|uniref:Aminoglycoside phosphotransferase domain-containing protein n=1 Tax=Kribbella italica TaxID=1540520 RepID=A0A7W9J314_9ACTN|nr:phosphotransferase [Kribbella italica]MBB5834414.1 hypothetical protein [Kribbella italica]
MDDWANIRADLERRSGEPVLAFEPASGGSGGIKGIVRTTNDQYFLKAVPLSSPWLADCRVEASVTSPHSPRLRWTAEYAGHLVLAFDVAPGREPTEPWPEADLRRVLATTDRLEATATGVLPTVVDRMRGRCSTWWVLAEYGVRDRLSVGQLSAWERLNLRRLAQVEGEWERLVAGDQLLHFDLRHDNLRLGDDGRVWVLDWGRSCRGPGWVDAVCLLLESSIGALDAEVLFRQTARGAAADQAAVDAFLVALASYWRHAGSRPADEASAWIRPRQVRSGRATVEWLQRRWG